jgi:uncharacterized protein involved in exopolysaccharide biosynthesis
MNTDKTLSDYLYVLYKWKRFLIINLLVVGILSTTYALLLPLKYKAVATVMIPADNSSSLGSLGGLLGNNSPIASIGANLLGISGGTTQDILLGILNSRTTLTDVIKKFNLMDYYEIKDSNTDKALKAFIGDVSFDINEYGMIDVSVINKEPLKSAEIANYFISIMDSLNIKLNAEQAHNNRIFIEKRYNQNVADLKSAEDSLYKFQKKYGIVAVPEQIEVSVKAAADVESELVKNELTANMIKAQLGEDSPQYKVIKDVIDLLKNKINELKNSSSLTNTSNVLYPFKELPDISIKYLRYFREVQTQQDIMEVILPLYEQAKVEEHKSIPTIQVLDKAVPPELKYSPKRSLIILGALFLFSFFFIPFVFVGESAVTREKFDNPLQEKENKFFSRILKIYRIKG